MNEEFRIRLNRVSKWFANPHGADGRTAVLSDVTLDLQAGEFVCLLGPSGCGKSTILNLIAGFEQANEGSVLLDGRPVRGPGPERGMVFQQPTLFPWLSVRDNVTFGPRLAGQWQQARGISFRACLSGGAVAHLVHASSASRWGRPRARRVQRSPRVM